MAEGMIIPIELETSSTPFRRLQSNSFPLRTFPKSLNQTWDIMEFGDILVPALSKYFKLRDSTLGDFRSLLAKEHPLKIESFTSEGDNYELKLDVKKFKPEEIAVKITDRCISIIGKHEDKTDEHNFSRQEFLRRYTLPGDITAADITCELSSDGYLLISAPKVKQSLRISEVPIPIHISATGPSKSIH